MTDARKSDTIVHPNIKEFTNNLALLLQRDEKIMIGGTGAEKLEKVLLACDDLLQPNGNFILLNSDLPLRELFQV